MHIIKSAGKFYYKLKGFYPVVIDGQKFRCDPNHLGFWRLVNKGKFEPFFYQILKKYLNENSVYCDIGSWIGPTVLYASRLCKKVYCFEPDTIAYDFLLQNIGLNKLQNVNPFNLAIGLSDGTIKMASHGGNPGDSMTSMVNIDQYKNFLSADSLKWQTWLEKQKPGRIDFLKIDIEGGEFVLLPA
ncbi:MAG: FkbM family methyltransferase, partial [Bacteroidales bacterium]